MFSREWIERFDASYGIPRKANEQYLPSYQAFWHWTADIGTSIFFVLLGFLGAFFCLLAGALLNVYGLIILIFWALALICVAGSFVDAYSVMWAYRLRRMSTAHGSARWAKSSDLVSSGLMERDRNLLIPANALPLAKAFRGRDVYLPSKQWLRHFVMFGPTGSGKSKTFFISMIRAILSRSSCLVYDPKGELFAQTAGSAKTVYRLDLNDPTKSDRWNFLPKCRNDPSFACQIAGMMLGIESRRKTNADPFWGDAEQVALTAILLHLAEVHRENAIPAFAADFLLSLSGKDEEAFNDAMMNSPSYYAKQAYLAFRQAPPKTRGSILIGLYNKLSPFILAPARKVSVPPTSQELDNACQLIDFSELRKPGTAIYIVVSEGAADIYKDFIATFIGQAVMELRLDNVNEPEHPCFVLIDEAYQLNVAEVKRISGIGRGRGVGLGLGYQDLPQMYDQYGREKANAILGTIMTKIFLPGLDDVTAEYASKQLGDTTIFSKTFQDYPGKKQDNTRYAEQKRALMLPAEIRQTAAHSEVLIISDTAPPIRAAYPPYAVNKKIFPSSTKGNPRELRLSDIDGAFAFDAESKSETTGAVTATNEQIDKCVDKLITQENLSKVVSPQLDEPENQVIGNESDSQDEVENALERLPRDVRQMAARPQTTAKAFTELVHI